MSDDESKLGTLAAVGVKLPPFWTTNPRVWFVRAEGQFRLKGIKSQLTMFDHCMSALSQELASTVLSAVEDPDKDSAYDDLKLALLERHAPHRITSVMNFTESSPISVGADPLLVKDQLQQFKIRDLGLEMVMFIAKMPTQIKHDLLKDADTFKSVSEAATAAKRLMGRAAGESVSAISSRGSARKPGPSKFRGRIDNSGLCESHARFGDRAYQCKQPCSWTGRKPTGRPQGHIRAIEDQGNDPYLC